MAFLCQKMQIKKFIIDYDVMMTSYSWCGPHFDVLIIGAEFRVCMFSSFGIDKLKEAVKHKIACCVANSI